MLLNILSRIMALLMVILVTSAATMALDVKALGSAELDCYGPFANITGCGEANGAIDCSCVTYISSESIDVARSCVKNDPDQWNSVFYSRPCVKALIADVVAALLEAENASVKGISFDVRPSGSYQDTSTAQASQRFTPARNARLERRALVARLTANRDFEHLKINVSNAPASPKLSDTRLESDPRLPFTPVVNHASPLSKREPTQRPKWQPTTCTAPGVTCGNGGLEVLVQKQEIRSDANSETQSPSSHLSTRDARPSPKMPSWWPTCCLASGITCAESGGSDINSENDDTNQPSVSTPKREAQPAPKLPKWFPLLCTSFGIACKGSGAATDGSENGGSIQPSVSTAKREAEPAPKLRKWFPLLCTSFGIACKGSSASNDGSANDGSIQPSDSIIKRAAEILPMAEARPVPMAKHPKWKPTSCTARGMTCGHADQIEDRGTSDNAGADSTPATSEQSRTSEHNDKRDLEAVAEVWPRPGRSFFTDDESNALQIEDNTAFVT